MTTPFQRTRIAAAIAGLALALGAGQAFGAAFALQENSGSGLGNAFAGGAAGAEDAATVWANPAGMSRIGSMQGVGAIHLITPSMKFSNDGSQPAAVCPPATPTLAALCGANGIYQPLGNNGGDAGGINVVPNMYFVVPINKQWAFGLGVNAPFGLVTEYDDGWIGRYQALKSDVQTINVNPAVSFKVTDTFTIGAGANWQKIKATFTSNANYSGGIAQATLAGVAAGKIPAAAVQPLLTLSNGLDAKANVDGNDDAWGWNVGVLFEPSKNTRFGAHYRSSIKYHVTGNVNWEIPAAPALPPTLAPVYAAVAAAVNASPTFQNGGIYADIELPPMANLSFFTALNDRWDLMADAQWTGWSTLQDLTFVRTSGAILSSTPENFKDVWRFSLGANYKYSDQWKFRMGVAYDQSPVQDEFRTPRLPDSDRVWLSGGAQWTFNKNLKLDVGATYIWVEDGTINNNAGSTSTYGLVKGSYSNNVIIVSGQATYSF
ncbi:MAG: outer membrane protein transport protein [Betaproteobacteria bacterium]